MTKTLDIAVLVGSLRRESLTRRLVAALGKVAPPSLRLDVISIGDMPHYNQDLETETPPSWAAFRSRVRVADAVLFATPEYNRSIPGVLKNALDVGSRPYGSSVWAGKPAAVVSASPGAMGGFGANHHLRQPLVFLNMPTLQQPEMYFANVERALGVDDAFADDTSRQYGEAFMKAFEAWVTRFSKLDS